MRVPIRRIGNNAGIILPKPVLAALGVRAGHDLYLTLNNGVILLKPTERHPRAGWAKAAKQLRASGDDAMVWPTFANAEDADLAW